MIRLEKTTQIQRITDENERKRLVNEIKAAGPVLRLVEQLINDRIASLEGQLITSVEAPYTLAALVTTISELKKLTYLFEETTND
jgi:hypothetical protein